MHPKVNIKQIVIALIDRLAAYAAREAENEDPEETKRQEEAAARRLAEKVKIQKAKLRQNGHVNGSSTPATESVATDSLEWGSAPQSPTVVNVTDKESEAASVDGTEDGEGEKVSKGKEKEQQALRKFRGVPEDVKLFEVFWQQVVELIKVSCVMRVWWAWAESWLPGASGPVYTGHHSASRFIDQSLVELLSG